MYRPEEKDSSRYVEKLQTLYESPMTWEVFKASFYSDEGKTTDIYQGLVTYVFSLFTNNGNILFGFFGLVFGYFYSRNIWHLLNEARRTNMKGIHWLLIFSFAFVIGFWELNGVRMWTAAHIFFYGTYLFVVNGNKKGFLIAALSILVHFSFIVPVAIVAFFYFIRIPWKILYFVFIASFFISELNIGSIGGLIGNFAPGFLTPKIEAYTSDEHIDTLTSAPVVNWYVTYYAKSLGWVIFIMVSSIYFSGLSLLKSNKKFSNLFSFTLLFLTVGNIMSQLPSGGRYLTIARLFAMALLFLFYIWYDNITYKKRMKLVAPLLAFFIIVSLRMAFDTVTFGTIMTNPIIAAFVDVQIPLIDLLK